jgi:hypothetical protein
MITNMKLTVKNGDRVEKNFRLWVNLGIAGRQKTPAQRAGVGAINGV